MNYYCDDTNGPYYDEDGNEVDLVFTDKGLFYVSLLAFLKECCIETNNNSKLHLTDMIWCYFNAGKSDEEHQEPD